MKSLMATLIDSPMLVQAAGQPPKQIEEFIGRANTGTDTLSIARMRSPAGWAEPGQTPEFDEYTLVIKGRLQVQLRDRTIEVGPGQAVVIHAGEWVRYSTSSPEGAEYIAVCLPAFSPETVHRDEA